MFITFRKGRIAPFKGSFGDTQNGHVHVWCQHQVSGIKFTFLIHFRRLNWIFVFGFSDLLRSSEIAKLLLCPRNTPDTRSHMDFKKVPHTRNCSTTTWQRWQKKDHWTKSSKTMFPILRFVQAMKARPWALKIWSLHSWWSYLAFFLDLLF